VCISIKHRNITLSSFITIMLVFALTVAIAQPELPQRSNTVRATQPIQFGSFCITGAGGGTVSVGYDGSRSATGNIALLNIPPYATPAIFDIKLAHSSNVSILYDPPYLTLNANSGSMALVIGPTDKGSDGASFSISANIVSQLRVGGTLTVTGSSPPGFYSGNFAIRFSQQ